MLRNIRIARGLTQADLARRAKVTRPYITMLEQWRRDPSLKVLRRLAKALGVPTALLVGD